jgi:PIN domain nuclease of toxin-antitoxin system
MPIQRNAKYQERPPFFCGSGFPAAIPAQRKGHGLASLALEEEATLHLARLPEMHKDPFDRMLICQAIVQGLVILTPDELIMQYPIRRIW